MNLPWDIVQKCDLNVCWENAQEMLPCATGRFEARIGISGNKHIYLGLFEVEAEAARAYDLAVVRLKGVHASTNFQLSEYSRQVAEHELKQLEEDSPEVFRALRSHAAAVEGAAAEAVGEAAPQAGQGTGSTAGQPSADANNSSWQQLGGTQRSTPLESPGCMAVVCPTPGGSHAGASPSHARQAAHCSPQNAEEPVSQADNHVVCTSPAAKHACGNSVATGDPSTAQMSGQALGRCTRQLRTRGKQLHLTSDRRGDVASGVFGRDLGDLPSALPGLPTWEELQLPEYKGPKICKFFSVRYCIVTFLPCFASVVQY